MMSSKILTFGIGAMLLLGCASSYAQTTDIAIGSTILQPSVKRLGVNLGVLTFYDSGQITKNLVFRNPGFEGQIFQSTIRCASGSANTCVDDDPYSGWPADFWKGATVEFFFGRAQGRKDAVSLYTPAHGSSGGTFSFVSSGTAPVAGDYMIVRKSNAGSIGDGWKQATIGSGSIAVNTSDLPPGTAGRQSVALKAPGSADSAALTAYFDSTDGKTFLTMNGAYQLTFKAKGLGGGANTIGINLTRSGLPTYLNQTIALTNAWDTYTVAFNASEDGSTPGAVALTLNTVGQDSILLDDVSLVQTDSDPGNPTAFRDPVVKALETMNPGVLRFWAYQLGDTLDNLIAGPFARQRSGYGAFTNQQDDISFGLPEFLQLCETIGAEPWVVVPVTFSTTEAAHLIEYLAGPHATPYGAKRAAWGHPAPWSSAFTKIHLEFGNEAWNGGFKGGGIEYSAPYGQRAQAIFGAMRADGSYLPSAFDLVLGGQSVAPLRNQDIQNNCNNNDTFAIAPYMMFTIDSFATNEALFGPTFAAPEAFHSPNSTADGFQGGLILQNQKALQASNHPVPLATYEMNLHTLNGAITQAGLNNYTSSLGAGLAVIDSMLQQMRQGILTQNLFALQQYKFYQSSDGKSRFLWGSVVDMGVTDRRRPQYLAVQLANQALGGSSARQRPIPGENGRISSVQQQQRTTMLQTVHSGADPTWNQPLVNTVQLAGAHYLQSFAFSSGLHRSLIVFNLHRTSSLPITISGLNISGEVEVQQLTSASPTDTNEDSAKVGITTKTLSEYKASTPLSLPPYSMTLLRWTDRTVAKTSVLPAEAAAIPRQ